MTWFGAGYDKVEKKDKENKEAMRAFIPNFFVRDTDENVYISFLTSEPITFYEHFLQHQKRSYTCPDSGDASKGNCPLCAMGNKPSFRGAYLVIDHRKEEWEDRNTKEKRSQQHTLKVAKWGIRVLKQLQKLDNKLKKGSPVQDPIQEGILGLPFEVMRSGTGTDTNYSFTPINPNPEHFPRDFEMPEKEGEKFETLNDALIDAIKPLTKEQLLEKAGGGSPTPPNQGNSQPVGTRLNVTNFGDDDDVIDFG